MGAGAPHSTAARSRVRRQTEVKTDYERKSKYKTREYRGKRGIGGNIVYAGENLLDNHLFVHRVAPGGFDWGPDADDDRACQLAIALLAPLKGVDEAVENYHLFAENFVKRELTGDTWTVKRQELRDPSHHKQYIDREYSANTAPSPKKVSDLEEITIRTITYAAEVALAGKYEDVLWDRGNRRENLQRLTEIWAGTVNPSEDRVQRSHLYHILSDVSSNTRQTLVKNFETMGDLAGWACYGRNHSQMDGISEAAARQIRKTRPAFIRYFGGEEYIPEYDDGYLTFDEVVVDDEQQTLGATE